MRPPEWPRCRRGGGFAFGPFELDVRAHRLVCAGREVRLTRLQMSLLIPLVTRAGQVVSKDHLIETAWAASRPPTTASSRSCRSFAKILDRGDPRRYIETARLVAYSLPVATRRTDADLDALIEPRRALIDGRAALETLERTRIASARATFGALLAQNSDDASFHVGLANACALEFEATRADPAPDKDALRQAAVHAREAWPPWRRPSGACPGT